MKKLLALLLAAVMLFSFAACGDDSDKEDASAKSRAEEFLDKLNDLFDEYEEAESDDDEDAMDSAKDDIEELIDDDFNDIYNDLIEDDEDDAEEFLDDVKKVSKELNIKLDTTIKANSDDDDDDDDDDDRKETTSASYDDDEDADNKGNAIETLPPSTNNSSRVEQWDDGPTVSVNRPSSNDLQDYIDSISDQLDATIDSYKQQGLSLQVVARGDSLVYVCRFLRDIGDVSAARTQLKNSLDQSGSLYHDILTALKQEVPSAKSVIVEYQNVDGSVVYSREYR